MNPLVVFRDVEKLSQFCLFPSLVVTSRVISHFLIMFLIKAVSFVGNPWCSRQSSSHLCDTESKDFFTSTHTQVIFFLLNCTSSSIALSIRRLSMHPIDPCLQPFSSICISWCVASRSFSSSSITYRWTIALYSVFKHVIGRWSLAVGSSFLGIMIHLPSWSHDGSESSMLIISARAVAICGCSAVSFLIQKLVILSFPGDDQFFFFLMLL